jgi:hypothetical protein
MHPIRIELCKLSPYASHPAAILVHAQAELEAERREGGAREARHRLDLGRLRRRVGELEARNGEFQETLASLELERLRHWGRPAGPAAAAAEEAEPAPSLLAGEAAEQAAALAPQESERSYDVTWTPKLEVGAQGSERRISPGAAAPAGAGLAERQVQELLDSDDESPPRTPCTEGTVTSGSEAGSASSKRSPGSPGQRTAGVAHAVLPPPRPAAAPVGTERFANGAAPRQRPDGHAVTTYANGDVKQVCPSGEREVQPRTVHGTAGFGSRRPRSLTS